MTKRKILVIDDSVDYTRLVKLTLETVGEFEVKIESDPLNALQTARAFLPDVILLDYIMPGMNGDDFAHQLKGDPELEETPIVFLTGSLQPDSTEGKKAFSDGICLTKPAAVDDIMDAIDDAMAKT
ncbi:MAG: response regulator [Verrucomicrobiales bacterium]